MWTIIFALWVKRLMDKTNIQAAYFLEVYYHSVADFMCGLVLFLWNFYNWICKVWGGEQYDAYFFHISYFLKSISLTFLWQLISVVDVITFEPVKTFWSLATLLTAFDHLMCCYFYGTCFWTIWMGVNRLGLLCEGCQGVCFEIIIFVSYSNIIDAVTVIASDFWHTYCDVLRNVNIVLGIVGDY